MGGLRLTISLVLVVLPTLVISLCSPNIKQFQLWKRHECFCPYKEGQSDTSESFHELHSKMENSLRLVFNGSAGLGRVSFDLPSDPCYFSSYKIDLLLANASTDEACQNFKTEPAEGETFDSKFKIHSTRDVVTNQTSSGQTLVGEEYPPCRDKLEIDFFYIFTGCYYVHVTPHLGKNSRQPMTNQPLFVTTPFKREDFALIGKNATVAPHTYPSKHSLEPAFELKLPHSVAGAARNPMLGTLLLKKDIKSPTHSACMSSGAMQECCVIPENSIHGVCGKGDSNSFMKVDRCSYINDTMQCKFLNITPGNYCAIMFLNDDRCDHRTVWENHGDLNCIWTYAFDFPDHELIGTEPETAHSRWPVWVMIGLVVTGTFIALLYGLSVLLTIARKGAPAESYVQEIRDLVIGENGPLMSDQPQKILLLYARDCEPFMQLMKALRELLQENCKCEVLDCYDEENQAEIFTREHDWLLGHMNHVPMTDLRVVLVATECSAAHQLAQLGRRPPVEYRDPDPCDKIFPLALKLLKEDVNPHIYERVKLVEFSGFRIAEETPNLFPNPFTRYVLPANCKELIVSLKQLKSCDYVNMCDDDLKRLNSKLDDLLQFRMDNPTYLQQFIQ